MRTSYTPTPENGVLAAETHLNANHRLDGLARRWYETGQLEREIMYADGEATAVKRFAADGRLVSELRENDNYLLIPVR